MMYSIRHTAIILGIIGLLNVSVFSQAEYTDLVKEYVKINEGSKKIKDAAIKSTAVLFISGDHQDTLRYTEYDANGNIVTQFSKIDTSLDKKGEFEIKRFTYTYKDNILIEKIDISGSIARKYYITYDELANITKETVKEQGKIIMETEYEYDNLSRLIESSIKDVKNNCKISESYSYDSYNNLAKKSTKNECSGATGKPVNTIYSYKYDTKNRIIEKQATYPNAGYKILTYEYGKNGEILKSYESEGSSSYESTVYSYDDKAGNISVEKNEVMGDLTKKVTGTIQNDKFGNRVEEKYFDSNGKLLYTIKSNYEFYK